MKILISGASFAGLATAYWMTRLGHAVTVVEIASAIRPGGTAVDIRGKTVDIARRMGIFDAIKANRLSLERSELKNADDVTERTLVVRQPGQPQADDEFEIERSVLLNILVELVKDDVELVFDDTITALTDAADQRRESIDVTFARRARQSFDLVIGCDGLHSAVRKIWFGHDPAHTHFLEQYFSITIVDKLLIEQNTLQMFNVPGKVVMLNAYKHKTDIVLAFFSAAQIPYDYRNEAQQRAIIAAQFADVGWRTAELLNEVQHSSSFYFDKMCQIRMPAWTKGRVALVGDAGYCASPAAGMGGSLAIIGATALADAMRAHPGDVARAFRDYDAQLRPFIDDIQAEAVRFGVEAFVPRTEEAIRARNAGTGAEF